MFLHNPIRKLLTLINQSYYLIYFSSFLFKKNHGFIQEGIASEKVVIVEEEVDGADIDDIVNLENPSKLEFIDEECGNLIVVVNDGGELTKNINQKKKGRVLQ